MNLTNKMGLPEPIVQAIRSFERLPPAPSNAETISVTELIGPPQIRQLMKQYSDVLEEDASDRIWALLGSAVHEILARSEGRPEQAERPLSALIQHRDTDFLLTGTSDRIAITDDGHIVQDYKVASVWEVIYGVKPERIAQLNIYRYLLMEEQGRYSNVDRLQVVYLLRDWKKTEARNKPTEYPQSQVAVVDVPIWSYFETHAFIIDQLERHFFGHNPYCSTEERWARPTTYALMKKGNKKAIRVMEDLKELVSYTELKGFTSKDYSIEVRQGRNVRCEDYCPVAAVCPQWAALREVQSEPTSGEDKVQAPAENIQD